MPHITLHYSEDTEGRIKRAMTETQDLYDSRGNPRGAKAKDIKQYLRGCLERQVMEGEEILFLRAAAANAAAKPDIT